MTAAGFCAPRFLVVMTARLFAAALGCLVAIIAIVLFVGAPDIFPVFPLALNPDGSTDLGRQPVEQEGPIKGSQKRHLPAQHEMLELLARFHAPAHFALKLKARKMSLLPLHTSATGGAVLWTLAPIPGWMSKPLPTTDPTTANPTPPPSRDPTGFPTFAPTDGPTTRQTAERKQLNSALGRLLTPMERRLRSMEQDVRGVREMITNAPTAEPTHITEAPLPTTPTPTPPVAWIVVEPPPKPMAYILHLTVPPTYPITTQPTSTAMPTRLPTRRPTRLPTAQPSKLPRLVLFDRWKIYTYGPSSTPSRTPTEYPSLKPFKFATGCCTKTPSEYPTYTPTMTPTYVPSVPPADVVTPTPSLTPTEPPTGKPTRVPTLVPSKDAYKGSAP